MLYVQPFGEESNRCRQMAFMQARRLAEIGVAVLVLDLYGTGDSEGEYSQGTWERWLADIGEGVAWLGAKGYSEVRLWAVRHGTLLALHAARAMGTPHQLLLWQPVLNGQAALTQILRVELAAMIEQGATTNTAELRKRLQDGETVELSGYEVAGALAVALDNAKVQSAFDMPDMDVVWLEVLASAERARPRASAKAEADWRAAGARIEYASVVGPAFWQVWERVIAPDLIEQTCTCVQAWCAP